jgi:hypothetical protein
VNDFKMVQVVIVIAGLTVVVYFTHSLYFYCKVFVFDNLLSFYLDQISLLKLYLLTYIIITNTAIFIMNVLLTYVKWTG